jgi:hypothetical protein
MQALLRRLPTFPLPYVINVTPKVLPEGYRYAVAIPSGKKVVVWCTYRDGTDDDMCYLLKSRGQQDTVGGPSESEEELDDPIQEGTTPNNNNNNKANNKEPKAKPNAAQLYALLQEWPFPRKEQPVYLAKGSLAYGTYHDQGSGTVILEDLLWYAGVDVRPFALEQKQRLMMDWIDRWPLHDKLPLALPHGAEVASLASAYQLLQQGTVYPVHHLEVRSTHGGRPHLLLQPQSQHREQKEKDKEKDDKVPFVLKKSIVYRKHKPQYKLATVFDVMADAESDLYHLYCASSASASSVYCGLAGVPTLATSRWLQRLFAQTSSNKRRKVIPSTYCPDEDSDPDDDDEGKETNDTVTKLRMECWFHGAFQKWVPRHVVSPTTPLVDVNRL